MLVVLTGSAATVRVYDVPCSAEKVVNLSAENIDLTCYYLTQHGTAVLLHNDFIVLLHSYIPCCTHLITVLLHDGNNKQLFQGNTTSIRR